MMKLLSKDIRDVVIDIFKETSFEKRKILCDLNNIDYDLASEYLRIALFEKQFFEGNMMPISVSGFPLEIGSKTMNLRSRNMDIYEMNSYNLSYGIYQQESDEYEIEIPIHLLSEWILEWCERFDDLRINPFSSFRRNSRNSLSYKLKNALRKVK